MTAPVKIGDIIDNKFKVEGILGEGGMGVVVAALHLELDVRVALKFLLPEAFSNLEAVQRFIREARAAARIRSEHVARILDTGRLEDGSPFQVMELLDGEDLSKVLATRGAVAVEDAVSYVLQASEALAEAHTAGIIHRDLKPANLFLARKPDRTTILKVLDFGISKNLLSTEKGLTRSNAIVGSPFYMSPEQLTYGGEVDARSDIWSLGIILYELISGTPPFGGETLPQVVAGILTNRPRTVGDLRPGLSPAVGAAIHRCMMTNPADRYASVAELAHALAPFGPPSARESAERISRVMHHSYSPGALAPTITEAPRADGPVSSAGAAARSSAGLSGTAAPWSRTGGEAVTTGSTRSGTGAMLAALGLGLATLAVVGGGLAFAYNHAKQSASGTTGQPEASDSPLSSAAASNAIATAVPLSSSPPSAPSLSAGVATTPPVSADAGATTAPLPAVSVVAPETHAPTTAPVSTPGNAPRSRPTNPDSQQPRKKLNSKDELQ